MTGVWYSGEMNLDETELTLGLPGGEGRGKSAAKRVFSQTVDLSLGGGPVNGGGEAARKASAVTDVHEKGVSDDAASKLPEAKKQVVGWPPLRPSRVNAMIKSVKFVKVTVDGAPYGRKVDLQKHNSYEHLLAALQCMFSCFVIREHMKLVDGSSGGEYVPTYEDKDGDWMLVGDVPWNMFVESCKRLRLMKKTSEALGLGSRDDPASGCTSSCS